MTNIMQKLIQRNKYLVSQISELEAKLSQIKNEIKWEVNWGSQRWEAIREKISKESDSGEVVKNFLEHGRDINEHFSVLVQESLRDIRELAKIKKENENLEKTIEQSLLEHYVLTIKSISLSTNPNYHYLDNKLTEVEAKNNQVWIKGLIEQIKKGEQTNIITEIISWWEEEDKKDKLEAEIHLEALEIGGSKKWNPETSVLKEEIKDKSKLLQDCRQIIKDQAKENETLKDEIVDKSKLLEEARKIIKEQKLALSLLETKPLSKSPTKFKIFKEKAKIKFQQLIKREKLEKREFLVEIPTK